MPITDVWVDWDSKVIHVPKTATSLIQADPEIRQLDINDFRLQLKSLEGGEWGECFLDTHQHKSETVLSGTTFARIIEIINGYEVTFEDGQYRVLLKNANSNVHEVATVNQVSLVPFNSAGLISVTSGSGLDEVQSTQLEEVHERLALNTGRPVTHSEDGIDSANIDINITDNQDGTFTEERQ